MNKQLVKQKIFESWIIFRVFIQLKIDAIRLSFAIFMADTLQKAKNKQFYVIPNRQNKLVWVCNDDIKQMKRPRKVKKLINGKLHTFKVRMISKNTTHLDIMRECLYYTPANRNNSNGITVQERNKKRKAWLDYMEKVRMDRLYGKLKATKKH